MVDLAAFKDPALSILQVGGFDQGVTSSVLSSLKAGTCGQGLAAKILILEPVEEIVARIQVEHSSENPTVDALRLDRAQSMSSQVGRRDAFDVLLVTIEPDQGVEEKRLFLTQARGLLRTGGIFAVFDTLPNIRDK